MSTNIGVSVLEVESANTSATPSAKTETSTTVMDTWPVAIEAQSSARTTLRTRFAVTTTVRRSRRSAMAPAYSPISSHGSPRSSPAIATRRASSVCEATSSGPAAMAIPSPMLVVHDETSSHRNRWPRRAGRTVSTKRLTSGQTLRRGSAGCSRFSVT